MVNVNNGECLKVILDDPNRHSMNYHSALQVISETEIATLSCFKIKIWNINSGICLRTFGDCESFIHLSKEQIASCDELDGIQIWNLNNGECLRTLNENTGQVYLLKKLTRNSIIICQESDDSVKIWDTDTGNCLKVLQIEKDAILDLF
jgi:WD40 repeat protein